VGWTNYNAANHQTAFADKTLTYDNNGNLQTITDSSGTTTYTWNARNQLVGISGPSVSASFVYDGLGRRERKTINSNISEFLYDGLNPVQETSGAAILANILPGLGIDEFLTRTDVVAGATSNFLTDALGSPVAVTDNAGAMQTEYTYEPFGKTTFTGSSNSNPYQYTGRENDGTGLYYYRARFYHPQLQRFVSEDQIEFAGGDVNLYAYVGNDPLVYVDPLGDIRIPYGLGGSRINRGPQTPTKTPKPHPQPQPKPDPRQPHPFPSPDGLEGPHGPWPCVFVPWHPACGGGGHGLVPPVRPPPPAGRKDPEWPPPCPYPIPDLCPDPRA
jgi:RHS repeat-associated protein